MVSLFLFLNVNPTPAQGTLSSAVDLYTFCLSFDVVFRYVHSQISLAQVSVKMMLLSIFGSSPWLPHSFCLVVAGLCHRAHPKGCCHPPGPQPVLSFLPFFPVPPGCLMHCRARCLSGQRPPSWKVLLDTLPLPQAGYCGLPGATKKWPSPPKSSATHLSGTHRGPSRQEDVVKPRLVHFLPSQSLGCQGPHSLTHSVHTHVEALSFQALGHEAQACKPDPACGARQG